MVKLSIVFHTTGNDFIHFFAVSSIRAARSSLSFVNIPSSTKKFSLFHRELYLILEGRFSFLKNAGGKQNNQWCRVVTVLPELPFFYVT